MMVYIEAGRVGSVTTYRPIGTTYLQLRDAHIPSVWVSSGHLGVLEFRVEEFFGRRVLIARSLEEAAQLPDWREA